MRRCYKVLFPPFSALQFFDLCLFLLWWIKHTQELLAETYHVHGSKKSVSDEPGYHLLTEVEVE